MFKYNDGDDIDTSGVRLALFKSCVMLGEQVYLALKKMSNINQNLTDIELQPPSPYMDKFPYCECTVSFNSELPTVESLSINNTDVQRYL